MFTKDNLCICLWCCSSLLPLIPNTSSCSLPSLLLKYFPSHNIPHLLPTHPPVCKLITFRSSFTLDFKQAYNHETQKSLALPFLSAMQSCSSSKSGSNITLGDTRTFLWSCKRGIQCMVWAVNIRTAVAGSLVVSGAPKCLVCDWEWKWTVDLSLLIRSYIAIAEIYEVQGHLLLVLRIKIHLESICLLEMQTFMNRPYVDNGIIWMALDLLASVWSQDFSVTVPFLFERDVNVLAFFLE